MSCALLAKSGVEEGWTRVRHYGLTRKRMCSGGHIKAGAVEDVVIGDSRMRMFPSSKRHKSCSIQASWLTWLPTHVSQCLRGLGACFYHRHQSVFS
jgi:hypothetical protein